MSTTEKMNIDERRKYLHMMKRRYDQASRQERGRLLDEMEAVTALHRMNGRLARKPRQRQRSCTYGREVDDALRVIAESWDYICALVLPWSCPTLYCPPLSCPDKDRVQDMCQDRVRPSTGPSG